MKAIRLSTPSNSERTSWVKSSTKSILGELNDVMNRLKEENIQELVEEILRFDRIFIVGAGRTGKVMECFAVRLSQMGFDCHFVGYPTNPPIRGGELLVVGSRTGRTAYTLAVTRRAKEMGAELFVICGAPRSPLARMTSRKILIPSEGVRKLQPLGNLFEQSLLLLLDTVAIEIMYRKKLTPKDLALGHGNLL